MPRVLTNLRDAARVLTGRKRAGRRLTVFPDDVFLVSYPGSGSSWTRLLVGNLVCGEPVTFADVRTRIPEIYSAPDRVLRRMTRPRVLKSHESFDPRCKKVIYTIRDPREVAVSYYQYLVKGKQLPEGYNVANFVHRFLAAEFDIQRSWTANWQDHVLSWMTMRQGKAGFLFLRYEEMLMDTTGELAKVASFLGMSASPERIAKAVNLSSADHMRKLERKQGGDRKPNQFTRQDEPFVLADKADTWQGILPASSVAEIESAWGSTMQELGYSLSGNIKASR